MNIANIVSLIIIGTVVWLLITNRHNFTSEEKTELSGKQKLVITSLTVLALIPVLYMGMAVLMAFYVNQTDFWYQRAAKQVSYHLYQPKIIPGDRVLSTVYETGTTLAGNEGAVMAAFNYPLEETIKSKSFSVIILRQNQVISDFNLGDYLKRTYTNGLIIEPITIPKATNQQGYLVRNPKYSGQKFNPQNIFFISKDGVLIQLGTANASLGELTDMATSLY